MSELAHPATDYGVVEQEPPAILERNLRIGSRLWASAVVFFFFAFLFAYFYLRSLNSAGLWRPKHVDPSLTLGTLVTAAVVAAAVLLRLAYGDHRRDELGAWRLKGAGALALVLAAFGLQLAEWATQGFGPTEGGYASVFLGWTGMQSFFIVGLAYWVETTLATSLRYREAKPARFEPGEAAGDEHRGPDISDPLSLVRHQLEALSFYGLFLAGTVVVSWVVLYLL